MKLNLRDIKKEQPKEGQKIISVSQEMIISGTYQYDKIWGHMFVVRGAYIEINKWLPIEDFEAMFEREE